MVRVYDEEKYNELLQKHSEELSEDEKDYITFCFHWEEGLAGML